MKAAADLQQKDPGNSPNIVNAFNTILFELTILGKSAIKPKDAAISGELPKELESITTKREYYSCTLVQFKFRGIPQRVTQQAHYAFGGKTEVTFSGYALNKDELDMLTQELDKSDINEAIKLSEGVAGETLDQMQEDIDFFLKEEEEEKPKKQKDVNPFMALIGRYDKEEEKKNGDEKSKSSEEKKDVKIGKESYIEANLLRPYAAAGAADTAFKLFDIYKKAHQMASYT